VNGFDFPDKKREQGGQVQQNAPSNQSNEGQASRHTNTSNYQQNTQNRLETTYNAPNRQEHDPFNQTGAPIEVSDDDLPF